MHYLLGYNMIDEDSDINLYGTIYDEDNNVVKAIFDEGTKLETEGKKYTIIVDKKDSLFSKRNAQDKVSAYAIDAGDLFLISPDAYRFFIAQGITNIQFLDVDIKLGGVDNFLEGYKIVNVLDKIDCADYEKSDIDYLENGEIMSISKLVLIKDKIPKNIQIFLLGKYATGIVIVSEALKNAIDNSGLSGFEFFSLEDAGELY